MNKQEQQIEPRFNLVLSQSDRNNLINILDGTMIKGADAGYILNLKYRITIAEEIEKTTPPEPEPLPDLPPVDPEDPSDQANGGSHSFTPVESMEEVEPKKEA